MKLDSVEFESEVFGAEKEMEFSIDTESSVIFDILRDKMYTNKISAVCREVASNSRDANVENGKADVPIEISIVEPFELESISDKSIVFADCGQGIAPSRMADVFVKYASSTKRDTNEQVGGFGLGAKTPFAYSDTFTVITVCDIPEIIGSNQEIALDGKLIRMKYIYTAMIDESNKGKMILFDSEETDEETGTKIVVPFKDGDRASFEYEVHTATSMWDVRPKLSGFIMGYKPLKVLLDESADGYKILDDSSYHFDNVFMVAIDGIPYRLDTKLFTGKFGDFVRDGLGGSKPFLLPFKTGELSVSANREGLHYTEKTIKAVEDRLEKIIATLEARMNEYLSQAPSYIESCIRLNEIKNFK